MMQKKLLAFFIAIFSVLAVFSQHSNSLFLMHETPQVNMLNPAIEPACDYYIGFPGLSSVHGSVSSNRFSFLDVLNETADPGVYEIDLDYVLENVGNSVFLNYEAEWTPLAFGFRRNDVYYHFHLSEKNYGFFNLPEELLNFIWKGNAQYIGETVSFRGLKAGIFHYREYAFGASKDFNRRLRMGAKAKFLFGKINFYSVDNDINLTTRASDYALNINFNTDIRVSFPLDIVSDDEDRVQNISIQDDATYREVLMNAQNKGIAFDFGFVYKLNDDVTISGSALDLGFIRWQSDVTKFWQEAEFAYEGTGVGTDYSAADYLQELGEDFVDEIRFGQESKPYLTLLPYKFHLAVERSYTSRFSVGAVGRAGFYHTHLQPSLTMMAKYTNNRFFAGNISNTIINGRVFNPGGAVALRIGMFQIHAASDNLMGFLRTEITRLLNLRFGISLIPGCHSTGKKSKLDPGRFQDCYGFGGKYYRN